MKRLLLPLALFAVAGLSQTASAADFFDTSNPETVFSFGVRVGLNTSNASKSTLPLTWENHSWGIGFKAGIVADINVKDFIAIQPGFFYETRNGAWTEIKPVVGLNGYEATGGKTRLYNFTIPILASFRFNVTDDIRWSADIGPYVALKIGTHDSGVGVNTTQPNTFEPASLGKQRNGAEFGFKIGTGVQVFRHYYAGIHYLAGCTSPWKHYSGRSKEWSFTIGYDF